MWIPVRRGDKIWLNNSWVYIKKKKILHFRRNSDGSLYFCR